MKEILERAAASPAGKELAAAAASGEVAVLKGVSGSAYALYAAAVVERRGGVHIFVCGDRDAAAYLMNDFYSLLGEEGVMFFPTGYKRSVQFGQEDASGVVQRTAALNALRGFEGKRHLVVCTHPEALAEKVADAGELGRRTVTVGCGERMEMSFLADVLEEYGFTKVDFVYEPGQYSLRGGIIDIFSFAENRPCRIDFFGDEVESIRRFDIASQLSTEKLEQVEIVPDMKGSVSAGHSVSLPEFAGEAVWWADDLSHTLRRVDDIRKKMLAEADAPERVDARVTSARQLSSALEGRTLLLRGDGPKELSASRTVVFDTLPQPAFNKRYELLAKDIHDRSEAGYKVCILSDNKAQIERLGNIFASEGFPKVKFAALPVTLHEGFVDNGLRLCLYTDHQLFERYQRYSLRGEIDRSQALTVAELNELKPGDYVVHIDHGVGRFGGLVRTVENGKVHEAVKLEYRDGDVLLVNVHALHRISRYKDKDSDTPPRVYKLGSGAWQRMKNATKSAVKDIARELIKLYAERKESGGFAFSPDGYLQHELEASFPYEETPDQQQAVELVKHDMEQAQPMDRLVCGDVGFGKTEVAVRAAFKAVADSKQVAVLVPTTILSLQHYRTFSERLRGLPVRVENLSRVKSAREVKQIREELAAGKIDILIGTHKILGKDIRFHDLGLLIIDEEQKFGVSSKEKLRQMSVHVDTLTLTATPIPRTLQFSLMGARDLSVIATPPPNRRPIVTESHLFDEEIIREAVEAELARHGQVFFVHNRVDNIEQIADLIRRLCPKAKVVTGHGQMPAQQLEKLVMDFIYGEFDVLVATTIIENGVDIPNANTIIINDAQNFGLSDLHQLRGRVGRSDKKGYCYLLTPPDELLTSDARRRIRAVEEFSDLGAGFNIAMQDLDIRGAGNLLGAEQSGFIADMGFETYQKILAEAVAELRAEGVAEAGGLLEGGREREGTVQYLTDAQIETDIEALLPDDYIGQSAEKLRLYRELDSMNDEQQMRRFEERLTDRFGALPDAARSLMDVVRLRWRAVALGFEWVKVKNGLMLLRFISDSASPYYKSALFMGILKYVSKNNAKFVLKQNNNRLMLTVREVKGMGQAWEILDRMHAGALAEGDTSGKNVG